MVNQRQTELTRNRYNRIAPVYDTMETLAEAHYHPWRQRLWLLVRGPKVLEVGVGTGKNMPFYPQGVGITAIDLTPGMLARARRRAADLHLKIDLRLGDAQALDFADHTFDEAVATFVFCSVPDPILGLREMGRVVKSGGSILLLEHVRAANAILGALMDVVNPIVVRMMGPIINRRTVENVRTSGLQLERVEDFGLGGIFKLIVARAMD